MSANLDRPLSDIIDEQNKANPRRGGRGGARRGGAGGQRRNNNNSNNKGNNNSNNNAFRNPLARDDEAQDDQNGGGGYGPQRRGRMDTRAGPYGDDSWKHDMYGSGGPRQLQRPSGIGFKLMVSNLDNAVTNADLQEIFSEIGPIQTVAINTDKEGRPIGTAEITFGSRAEADRALKEFDGAEVDGRPMYLKLVSAPPRVQSAQAAAPAPRQNNNINFSIGSRPQRGGMRSRGGNNQSRPRGGSAGRGRGGAGGRGGRGGRSREPKENVTTESLDAEMESYRKSATGTGAAAAPAASS